MSPMKWCRISLSLAIVAGSALVCRAVTAMPGLSEAEMSRSVGASTGVAKCQMSCNAANSVNTKCVGQADGTQCKTCANAATTTDYPDQKGAQGCDSKAPGWQFPNIGKTTDCGKKLLGSCVNQICVSKSDINEVCSDPTQAVQQQVIPAG